MVGAGGTKFGGIAGGGVDDRGNRGGGGGDEGDIGELKQEDNISTKYQYGTEHRVTLYPLLWVGTPPLNYEYAMGSHN